MRKMGFLLLVLAACVLTGFMAAFVSPARAGFPMPRDVGLPRTYPCLPTASAPAIDGSLDDAAWDAAPWTEDFIDIQGPELPGPRLRTRAKMLWDSEYFYVAAQMGEPHVWAALTQRDAVIYHDNDFEVFIDPDGDNHLYYELEINALGTEWDLLLVKPYRDGAPAVNAWDIQGLKTGIDIQGTRNDPSDTDTGWTVEIAIPWPVLAQCAGRPAPPEPGHIWRVNFSRVQWRTRIQDGQYIKLTDPETGQWLPEDNWVWSPQGLIAMHYPEQWGEVLFVGPGFGGNLAKALAANPEHEAILAGQMLMEVYYQQRLWQEQHGRFAANLEELGFTPGPVARGWAVTLSGRDSRFLATLTAPRFSIQVDELGRLARQPICFDEEKP